LLKNEHSLTYAAEEEQTL